MKDNLARLPSAIDREIREAEGGRQRKRLEAQLQQAMKMEAIGRLAGGVAHDFNNLLTVIAGFAQLALLDDNPARAGLEQILLAAERASGLTRQLLAFSRQQALEPRVFDLNQLVRDMEKMLSRLIGEDIEVATQISEEPLRVKADPGQIEQVLLNLAVNSRDAMPSGKLVLSTDSRRLEGAEAVLQGVPDNDYCTISVSDSGDGNSGRRAAAHLRTLLHDEAGRQGHGAGTFDCVWNCAAVRRVDSGGERKRRRPERRGNYDDRISSGRGQRGRDRAGACSGGDGRRHRNGAGG